MLGVFFKLFLWLFIYFLREREKAREGERKAGQLIKSVGMGYPDSFPGRGDLAAPTAPWVVTWPPVCFPPYPYSSGGQFRPQPSLLA